MLIPSAVVQPPSGSPADTLLEGFEAFSGGVPTTLPWESYGLGYSITQSGLNVTQGSFSGRIQNSIEAGGIITPEGQGFNLTGAEVVELDIHITTIGITDFVYVNVYSVVDNQSVFNNTAAGATGTSTITVDLSPLNDLTQIEIDIANLEATAADYYIDNLRSA